MSNSKVGIDENGWVRTGPALNISGVNIAEKKEFDGELPAEPRDPNKHETAVHWNNGDPELRETGNPQPPEPDEARGVILTVAETELGWDQAKIRSVRNDQRTNLFFDYVTEGNYEGAKTEIDYLVIETDFLDEPEGQTFKDALDGKL